MPTSTGQEEYFFYSDHQASYKRINLQQSRTQYKRALMYFNSNKSSNKHVFLALQVYLSLLI